jgi:hypothetical protein
VRGAANGTTAASSPTTDALSPRRIERARAKRRRSVESGAAAANNKNEGAKIASVATPAPSQLEEFERSAAPKNAAKVKSGPGIACTAPYPAKKSRTGTWREAASGRRRRRANRLERTSRIR